MKRLLYLVFLIISVVVKSHSAEFLQNKQDSVVQIIFDVDKRFQTIEGFGSCIVNYRDFPPEYSDSAFFKKVVNDLGLSIVRVPLMEHLEWENDDDDATNFNWDRFWLSDNLSRKGIKSSMLLMNEFKKYGVERFMGTPWSPPDFLKTNRSPIQGGYLRADMFDEYAEYIAAQIILAKKNYGIDLNWVSVQNELLFAQFYRSCVYQPWILKEAVRALMKKFKQEGINTLILMPEDMMFVDRMLYYIQPTMNDPETKNYPGHFTTHRRGGAEDLKKWVAETSRYNRQNWMTETSGHDQTWPGALKMANDIQEHLVHGNFSAWIYWQLSGGGDGRYSILVNGKPGVKYYASKHFYRYIRPGAFRISATCEAAGLSVSAFHNPYDGTLSSVILNNSDSLLNVLVNNEIAMEIYLSYEKEQFIYGGKLNPGSILEVPAKSIITLYGQNQKLITGEEKPELPEAWKVPEEAMNEVWGNSDAFPGERPFQVKPDGGNISLYPDLQKSDPSDNVNEILHNGWTLLHLSIMNGDGDVVKYLIENGADINARANDGWTPLHMASSTFADNLNKNNRITDYNKYDIFKLVMEANPDITVTSKDGWTALHAAVANAYTGWRGETAHSLQRIADLINEGIDIESKDINGRTALHWACLQGYLHYTGVPTVKADAVTLLVKNGADLNATDNAGKTPLHYAVEMGYPEIVLFLVKESANAEHKDKNGNTPQMIAEKNKNTLLQYILLNAKMPVDNAKLSSDGQEERGNDRKYGPELLKAAWSGDIEMVRDLLSRGADMGFRDSDGFSALERARDNGHTRIVNLIENSMKKNNGINNNLNQHQKQK